MAAVADATQFTWCPPTPDDREALKRFACAHPDKRTFLNGSKVHPRPWELTAQTAIRTLNPRMVPPKFAVLAKWNSGDIAAAAVFEVQSSGFRELALGWIFALGVHQDLRGQGLGHFVMDRVVDRMIERVVELNMEGESPPLAEIRVGGKVHKLNKYCRDFLTDAGWQLTSAGRRDEVYDEWSVMVPVAG